MQHDAVVNLARLRELSIAHKALFEDVYKQPDAEIHEGQRDEQIDVLRHIERSIYPFNWAHFPKGIKSLLDSYTSGKGIVMTTGVRHFRFTQHNILVLRHLNCTLPIEVFYNGHSDLPKNLANELSAMPDVSVKDLNPFFNSVYPFISGWGVKPFVMLFSTFKEVIFLDSDSLLFQDPRQFFGWSEYESTGSLYFRDRTLDPGANDTLRFFQTFIPEPSRLARENRVWNRLSNHEAESGVIVMDKGRGGIFVLLLAGLLNIIPYSGMTNKEHLITGNFVTVLICVPF